MDAQPLSQAVLAPLVFLNDIIYPDVETKRKEVGIRCRKEERKKTIYGLIPHEGKLCKHINIK